MLAFSVAAVEGNKCAHMFVTASIQAGELAWPQAVELVAKTGDSQLLERLKAELSSKVFVCPPLNI